MPPARGVAPGSCRACGGRVAFSGGACRVSPGGCSSATCLPRTGEVGDSEVAAERRPRGGPGGGGVVGAGRDPSDPAPPLPALRGGRRSGAARGCGGDPCSRPAPSRQPSRRQVSPAPYLGAAPRVPAPGGGSSATAAGRPPSRDPGRRT